MADNKKLDYIQEKIDSIVDSISKVSTEVALNRAVIEERRAQDDRMYEEFIRLNNILQQNTESLKEHMHRSDLLEDLVTKIDTRLSPIEVDFIEKAAVKHWITARAKFIGKLGGAIVAVGGAWFYIKPLIEHFLSK